MGLFSRWFRDPARTNISGKVDFVGICPLGAAGAVAASYSAGRDTPGFTVTKVGGETGRYRVQLVDSQGLAVAVLGLFNPSCMVEGAADAAYTTDAGLIAFVRNVTPASGFFDIQLCIIDDADGTFDDANPENNARLHIGFSAKTSSAVP